jgi:hypothetical protein
VYLVRSPSLRARAAFEGAEEVVGDPASVEAALLRLRGFAIDGAEVHQRGKEGDCVADGLESEPRALVGPGASLDLAPAGP